MIIRFAAGNFRSIRGRAELSMEKTSLKGLDAHYVQADPKLALLKSAVLYGPNASGKSSFLRAFKALEYLVTHTSLFKPDDRIPPYEPHKLDRSCIAQPVAFEIEFISNGTRYEYLISFDAKAIRKEELYHYPNAARNLLFSRAAGKEIKFGESYRGGKKTIGRLLLDNQLFLSKAAENNAESVRDAYAFFSGGLMVFPFMEAYREAAVSTLFARRLAEDRHSAFARRFNQLICALDTGILSISAEEVDWNQYTFPGNMPEEVKSAVQEQFRYDIKTQHPLYEDGQPAGTQTFELHEESAGTQSLFVTGGIILDALESGRVLIVDEFEKNLHPAVTQYLIQLFHSPLTNPLNAQLIFATHDITQLSSDRFRRDQVWFTEKDEAGSTALFRCSDIKGVRLDTPLDKWYASGRFGATPVIQDVGFLIEMQSNGN